MESTAGSIPSAGADAQAEPQVGREAGGPTVVVRYWAGAKAAAGVAEESVTASTLGALLDAVQARRDERFANVLRLCSVVVSEQPVAPEQRADFALRPHDVVDVLPPFAGGSHPA